MRTFAGSIMNGGTSQTCLCHLNMMLMVTMILMMLMILTFIYWIRVPRVCHLKLQVKLCVTYDLDDDDAYDLDDDDDDDDVHILSLHLVKGSPSLYQHLTDLCVTS